MTVFFRRKCDHESKELAIWNHCYRPEGITVSQSGDLRISHWGMLAEGLGSRQSCDCAKRPGSRRSTAEGQPPVQSRPSRPHGRLKRRENPVVRAGFPCSSFNGEEWIEPPLSYPVQTTHDAARSAFLDPLGCALGYVDRFGTGERQG